MDDQHAKFPPRRLAGRSLWVWWALAGAVCGIPSAVIWAIMAGSGAILVFPLFGIPFGLLESQVLRRHVPSARSWGWATFVGWSLAWMVGLLVASLTLSLPPGSWFHLPVQLLAAAAGGSALGMSQSRAVAATFRSARSWVCVSALGVLAFCAVVIGLQSLGCAPRHFGCNWLPAGILGGLAYGAITGFGLVRLSRDRSDSRG
jgi:hypothetical protein